MVALIAVETLLLLLLTVVVTGLLRSHAEILRRLGPAGDNETRLDPSLPAPPLGQRASTLAPDVAGTTLDGQVMQFGIRAGGESTLLAFLSSGCLVCEGFWEVFGAQPPPELPGGGRILILTKDSSHESPSRLRELAPAAVPVVMSSAAWKDYSVPTAPYFVHVDGASGEVRGEGTAAGWPQVVSLLRDAIDDARGLGAHNGAVRARRVDADLEAAGIQPGHPSLYPGAGREPGQ
jgi:hypothetical protein